MAGKKNPAVDADDADGTTKEKGSLLRLVMVGILSVSIAAAGYFVGGAGSSGGGDAGAASETDDETEAVEEVVEPEISRIVDLDPVNVNLTDGHYLRVAISLGVAEHHDDQEDDGGHGGHGAPEPAAEPDFPVAPAADLLLATFSRSSMSELSEPNGRSRARDELEHHLREYYGSEKLVAVFFTEFVMQ